MTCLGEWFQTYEYIAVWVEGIALVLIFGLDYLNRVDQGREHKRDHKETLEQLNLLRQQAEAAKLQADSSWESLRVLKAQSYEQQLRELWRVLPILDDLQGQVRYWLNLFDENRWGAVNKASRLMPDDSGAVVVQAARHSNELWAEVRDVFRSISNAENQIGRYYSVDNPNYRQESLVKTAHGNLKNAEPKLTHVVAEFTAFEEAERKRSTP